jgi:putative transposase
MARRPRIEFAGAVYHVMSRGNRGETIFHDDDDRRQFLHCLDETCERTGWKIHAYVLMANHYHFLLETPEPNLVVGMKWLQGTYTQRFNRRHSLHGHLFQGRYKTLVIDGAELGYFLVVSSYIHLNPARAGLVRTGELLEQYRWSSYPSYLISPGKRANWLCVDRVLGELGARGDGRRDRQAYRKYTEELAKRYHEIEERKDLDREWKLLRRGWYLGSESFREKVLAVLDAVLDGKERESYQGEELRAHDEAEADRILQVGLRVLKLKEQDFTKMAKGAPEKQVLAWWLRKRTVVGRKWISQRLKMGDVSRVTQAINAVNAEDKDRLILFLKKRLGKSS